MMTGSNKRESEFQRRAKKFIESKGGYVTKVHVSSYQAEGEPDLIVCYKGYYIALELKVEDNKPSKLQEEKIRQITRAGGIARPVWTLEEIEEILYEVCRFQQDDKS